MNDETKQIADVIDMLRAKGVLRFKGEAGPEAGEIEVEFFPPQAAEVPVSKPSAADEPEVCKCGHPEYAHGVSGCVMGCALEVCAPPSEVKP